MAKETKIKTKKDETKAIVPGPRKKRATVLRESIVAEQTKAKQEIEKTIKKEAFKSEAKKVGRGLKKEIGKVTKKAVVKKPVETMEAKGATAQKKSASGKKKSVQGKNERAKSKGEKRIEIREGIVYEEVRTEGKEVPMADGEKKVADEVEEIKDESVGLPDEKIEDDLAEAIGAADEEEKTFIKWTGKNFLRPEGQTFFYEVSLVASIVVILWSLIDRSWLSALTFLSLAVMIVVELKDVPKDVEYEISIDGILIDGKLYKFDDIRSFGFTKKEGVDIVKLQLHNSIFPTRELHLAEGQDLVYIETLLAYFLPKEEPEDTLFNFRKRGKKERDMTEEELINQKVDEYLNPHHR